MTVKIDGSLGIDAVAPNTVALGDLAFTPQFSKSYTSPEQTMTAAGLITLTHGLGERPKLVRLHLVCKVAQNGWLVGEELPIEPAQFSSNSYNYSYGFDATSIKARCGSNGCVVYNASGVISEITLANWRLVVRAWA